MRNKKLKKIHSSSLLIFLLIFQIPNPYYKILQAESLLFKSKEASSTDFNAFLKTDVPYTSFKDFYLKKRPHIIKIKKPYPPQMLLESVKAIKKDNLSNGLKNQEKHPTACDLKPMFSLSSCLKEAQKAYLLGDLEKAKNKFYQLTRFSLLKDWKKEERKALHYSFLRLAQITKNPEEKKEYLMEAQAFFPGLSPDPALFSPTFLKKYNVLLKQKKTIPWMPTGSLTNYSSILVNGKTYHSPFIEPIEIPKKRPFRLSFISNSLPLVSEVLNAKRLKDLKIKKSYLIQGTCEKSILTPHFLNLSNKINEKIFVFFNPYCIKSLTQIKKELFTLKKTKTTAHSSWNQKKTRTERKRRNLFKYEKIRKNESPHLLKINQNQTLSSHFNQKSLKNSSFLKNKWLWIGVSGFLVTSIALYFSNEVSGEPQFHPKRKKGF